MSERNNKAMFTAPTPPANIPTQNIDDFLGEMLGKTASVLHDHIVPLPSRGVPYPEGHPLRGVTEVKIRSMRSSDEDILLNQALFKSGTMFTELIRACLIEPRVNPKEFLVGDRIAILIAIRISGHGAQSVSDVKCPSCGTKSTMTFNMNEFPIKYLDLEPAGEGNLFRFTFPLAETDVLFRFQTGADEEDAFRAAAQNKPAEKSTDYLKKVIHSIAGISDRTKISLACDKLPPADTKALRRFIRDHEPRLGMEQTFSCPSCGHTEEEVALPLQDALFRSPNDD